MKTQQSMKTYKDSLLERGNNFALHMDGGWLFGRVLDLDRPTSIVYNRYNTLAGLGYKATVGTDTTASTWNIPQDANSSRYLYEDDKDRLLQAFVGISPAPMKVFIQFPESIPRGALSQFPMNEPFDDATPGAIDGYMSPFAMPTDAGELMIPAQTNVALGLYNPKSYAVNPVLNFVIQRMKVRYLDKDKSVDKQIIESIINGGRCKYWSPGVENWSYNSKSRLGIPTVAEWRE